MGTITSLAEFRQARAQGRETAPVKQDPFAFTRTPALALFMALYEQLPRKYTGVALARVMMMAEQRPDCEVSQEAGRIAALLALTNKEGR